MASTESVSADQVRPQSSNVPGRSYDFLCPPAFHSSLFAAATTRPRDISLDHFWRFSSPRIHVTVPTQLQLWESLCKRWTAPLRLSVTTYHQQMSPVQKKNKPDSNSSTAKIKISANICETWAGSWMSINYFHDVPVVYVFSCPRPTVTAAKRHGSARSRACLANQSCNHQRRWRRAPTPYNHRCLGKGLIGWWCQCLLKVCALTHLLKREWPVIFSLEGMKSHI